MATLLGMLIPLVIAADPLEPGDHSRKLSIKNRVRSYLLHIPEKYDHQQPTPVLLAFHGGGSNPEAFREYSGLNEIADEKGFILVYPRGTGRLERVLTFNGGNCCGYAMTQEIDDVEYVRQILDDLAKLVNVDQKRVFATGMSNGGIISYRLASELSDRIAAIAPVGGPMGTDKCNPKRPVSVIHFHGTKDENAPLQGGKGKGVSGTEFFSVEHSISAWIKANGCDTEPKVSMIPDTKNDGTTITRKTYGSGKEDSEVVLVLIEGGGHTWPGRTTRYRALGKSTKNISANDLMWEFFEKHPMK